MNAEEAKIMIYEGILQLFCRSSLVYSPELKSLVEEKLSTTITGDQLAQSRTLATFACKLILKLTFSGDSLKKLTSKLVQYVFEKGFLRKTNLNGTLYAGMSLNIYMLLLTSLQVPNPSATPWRQDVCMNLLIPRLQVSLESEAAKKNTILT